MALIDKIPRGSWPSIMALLPEQVIHEAVSHISETWAVSNKIIPKNGLGMLELQDTALQEKFYLGEFPVSAAHVSISLPDGREYEGAATIMTDDGDLAWSLAVCDAVLANRLDGWEGVAELLLQAGQIRDRESIARKGMCKTTKVDFSMLDAADGEEQ